MIKRIPYSETTQEQREKLGSIWSSVLKDYCPPVEIDYGGEIDYIQPCDLGSICDMCHHDVGLQEKYRKLHEEAGIFLLK